MKRLLAKEKIYTGEKLYKAGDIFEIEEEEVERLIELGVAEFATSETEDNQVSTENTGVMAVFNTEENPTKRQSDEEIEKRAEEVIEETKREKVIKKGINRYESNF